MIGLFVKLLSRKTVFSAVAPTSIHTIHSDEPCDTLNGIESCMRFDANAQYTDDANQLSDAKVLIDIIYQRGQFPSQKSLRHVDLFIYKILTIFGQYDSVATTDASTQLSS